MIHKATSTLQQSKIESETLLEGRAAEYSIGIEKRLRNELIQFREQSTAAEAERLRQYQQAITKMKEATLKFYEEYESKYIKAQLREEELRLEIGRLVKEESSLLRNVFDEKLSLSEEQLICI